MAKKTAKAHTRESKRMAKQGRYVCVVHMVKAAQKVMDRKRGKTSRSGFIREALAAKHGKVFLE